MSGLARLCLRHPTWAIALLVLCTGAAAAGLPRLRTDVGYRAFLGPDHPAVRQLDDFLAHFEGGLPLAAVWRCDGEAVCASALEPESLAMAERVARALAATPGVRTVHAPSRSPLWVPTPFGPVARQLLQEDGQPAPDLAWLARRAQLDPGWVGRILSADGRTGAVVAELDSSDSDTALAAYTALERALAPEEARGVHFARVGGPVEFVVAGGELEAATARLIPVMVVIVGAVLWALLRSLAVTVASLACVGLAVLWTQGLLGWLSLLGWAQTSLTQTLPPLVLVIGVCDAVHLASAHAAAIAAHGADDAEARGKRVLEACLTVGRPCVLTTLTTAVGFLSFVTAELESFVRFGALAAAGVVFALLCCFSALPLVLARIPTRLLAHPRYTALWRAALARCAAVARGAPRSVSAVALAGGALCGWLALRLEVDASFEDLYGRDSRVVRWVDFVATHLRRPDSLEVELELPPEARLAEPSTLRHVRDTSRALAAIETLGPAHDVVEPLSWLHRLLASDRPEARQISSDPDTNAALLSLLGGALGGPNELAHWVDPAQRRVRISVESGKTAQAPLRRAMSEVSALLADGLPRGWSGLATGPLAIVHDMIEAIRRTQLRSFAGAAFGVWLLVAVALRSPRLALLALAPTVLPVVVTLGVMGAVGLPLDVGSAMVAAVVLGLAVDDVIHLLEAYRRERLRTPSPSEAMLAALLRVGHALVTTSSALALGFLAFALSPWRSVASFGAVAAVAITGALLACVVVLPALVAAGERGRNDVHGGEVHV